MFIDIEQVIPNPYTVKPRYANYYGNYQGTTYANCLSVTGKGWFLAAYQHVGDDDGMTGYLKLTIDGVEKIVDMSLFATYEYCGVVRNLILPIRFESSLVVARKVAAINTGVGTTIIYDLD